MTVIGILFDLGGTLLENTYRPSVTFQKILEQKGIQVKEEEVQEALERTEADLADFLEDSGKIHSKDFYNLWDIQVLKFLGIKSYTADLISHIHAQWSEVCGEALFSDVLPTIEILKKKHIKIGIVTNAYEKEVTDIFQRIECPLTLFDCIVGVDTTGKRKPHPDIFHHALQVLDIPADKTLFIGDDIEKDYYGARQAGIRALLLAREGSPSHDVQYISSLSSIEAFL
ncbi:MAG: HAD family hydrolase [Theionarchaea archaeon]|nr:HAD family hydrolase [Theionarchaea archaeon]